MPSGSKKRKSSKKPKPSSQGEPPEPETGLDEGMAKDWEETGEGPPSPKTTEGDPQAMEEGGLLTKEINGEVLQEGHVEPEEVKEGSLTEEAFAPPHQQENCKDDDPPSQADPEPDIWAAIEGEAPARIEPEGEAPIEIAQGEPLLQIKPEIDLPLVQTDTATDAEIKREMETDAGPSAFQGDTDAGPDAPADDFKLEADNGQDEIELSIESTPIERESEPSAPPIVSEPRMDESPVETAPIAFEGDTDAAPADDTAPDAPADELADVGQDEIDLSIESAPIERESEPSAPPVVSESRMDESPAETPPEDAVLTLLEGDTDAAPDAPADELKSEADIGQDEIELSIESALVERESEPVVSESRIDESLVETAPANIEPENDTAPVEMEAGVDAEPEIDEAPVEMKPETDALPAHIEPEADETRVEIKPETDGVPADIFPEMEKALVDREPETDAAPVEVESEMDAAPADSGPETDVAQVEMDAFPVEVQPEIDEAGPGIETQTDTAACEIETDLLEMEPETEATPSEIKPEMNAAPIDTDLDEVAQAKFELEPKPEVEALPDLQAGEEVESLDTSLEIEAEMEPPQEIEREPKAELEEPPQEIEPEPKSELEEPPQEIESEPKDPAEDASFEIEAKTEPSQEIEPEPEVEAVDEAKPDDEESAEIKAEDNTSTEAELGQQDIVEGEVGASLEANREPEVGASREIEPEAETEVCLESEQKPEMAQGEAKSDKKGSFETESDQQDLVEVEPEQTDIQGRDQQEHIVDAPEVPVIEDELGDQVELPAISESDGAILVVDSIPDIETSIDPDNEEPGNEQQFFGKLDEAEDISPSAVALEGEGQGTNEGVSDDQDPGADLEQDRKTAVDTQQGVLDELADESKADIDEQERAGDDGPDDDQSVLASVGDASEMVVPCEQELGIKLPLADAIDVEECATEGALLNDQMLVTEQPQLSIDEQELHGAAEEPPSAESELVEQGLKTNLPSSELETTLDPYESKDEAVTSADEEKFALVCEFNLDSSSGELERDIGEEEAASSTVAEAGSVLNDFDENVHYEHELHTDFPSSIHIPDSRDFDDTLSPKAPELVEAGLEEQLDSEPYPTKEHTEINGNEVKLLASEGDSPADEVDFKVVQGLGNPCEQAEVLLQSADVAEAAEELHVSFVEEVPDDVELRSSPRPELVVQDNEEDKVHISKEGLAANKELKLVEEERAACEDGEGAATSILGVGSAKEFSTIAENELMSKALTTEVDGQYSLSRSEAPSNDLLDLRDESSIHHSEVNNMDEAEIHAVEAKELKLNVVGGDSSNDASKATVQSVSSDPEGRDIGVQAFRQESTLEASLPVVVPAQDRALEHVNLKTSGGAILEGRKNWLGCCGMFDVLLGKN